MKRERVNIEELFKQKFENAEIKPSGLVWNKVESNLNVIPKKLAYFRWFLSAVTLGIAVFLYYLWPSMQQLTSPITSQAEQSADIPGKMINPDTLDLAETVKQEKSVNKPETVNKTSETLVMKGTNSLESKILQTTETLVSLHSRLPIENTTTHAQMSVQLNFTASKHSGCAPLEVYFENISTNASDFEWNMGDGNNYTDISLNHVYEKPGAYIVSLKCKDNNQLVKTDTIVVFAGPTINAAVSIKETAETDEVIVFSANVVSGEKLIWSFGDGNFSSLPMAVHTYNQKGEYDVFCKKTSVENCTDSVFVKRIVVLENNYAINFPTAFAPNIHGEPERQYTLNANKNELFFPVYKGVIEYNLKIFNRYGALLFETNDINIGWTGYFKGKLVAQDVYIYKAVGKFENAKLFSKAGNVTVVY